MFFLIIFAKKATNPKGELITQLTNCFLMPNILCLKNSFITYFSPIFQIKICYKWFVLPLGVRGLLLFILLLLPFETYAWGFVGHQRINRLAIFTLPPEMFGFYKYHLKFLVDNSVNPDKRRYAVKNEAPRHYIDIDVYDRLYNDSAIYKMPRYWKDAVKIHSEDTLLAYGIVPWHIQKMHFELVEAFKQRSVNRILRVSADLGHYIADANVPLHTTENYNGQRTGQIGIHGFWESRLVELFSDDFDFFVGKASFLQNTQLTAWEAVTNAHLALDSVFRFERELTKMFPEDKKYAFEERNRITVKTYSRPFSEAFYRMLDGQVQRRMRASVKMVGDFWYTCWVEAGQPDLQNLINDNADETPEKLDANPNIITRPHEETGFWYSDFWKLDFLKKENNNPNNPHENCCQNNRYVANFKKRTASQE